MPIFANRMVNNIQILLKNIYMLVMLLASQNKTKVCQTFNGAFNFLFKTTCLTGWNGHNRVDRF